MEYKKLIFSIIDFSHAHRRGVQKIIESKNLFHGQLHILETIDEKGECTQKEICEEMDVSAPSITNSVKRLMKNGLIDKVIDENDMRRSKISLTSKGKDIAVNVRKEFNKFDQITLDGISEEEQVILYKIITKMSENIRKEENKCLKH